MVVGELQLLERNELAAPVHAGSRRVWVHVEPPGHSGLCLSRHRPAEPRKDGTVRDPCVTDQRARLRDPKTIADREVCGVHAGPPVGRRSAYSVSIFNQGLNLPAR